MGSAKPMAASAGRQEAIRRAQVDELVTLAGRVDGVLLSSTLNFWRAALKWKQQDIRNARDRARRAARRKGQIHP